MSETQKEQEQGQGQFKASGPGEPASMPHGLEYLTWISDRLTVDLNEIQGCVAGAANRSGTLLFKNESTVSIDPVDAATIIALSKAQIPSAQLDQIRAATPPAKDASARRLAPTTQR